MIKTTCLVIGDEHIQINNIVEVEVFIERIEKLALNKKPDFIVSLGDLLHTHERLNTTPMNKAQEFIDRLSKIAPVYSLVGNHDMCNNSQFLTENHWQNSMKKWYNVVVVDKVVNIKINGLKFVFIPYVSPGRFIEALNTVGEDWKDADCIFAHQEFYGCKMGAIVSEIGDKWSLDYPNIISGHIHSKQKIQSNIYYTGSAMQHAFGESTKNTVAFVSFDGTRDYLLEEIDLELPRKRILYKTLDQVEDIVIAKNGDKIKLSVECNYDEFKTFKKSSKYKSLVKQGVKIVFNHRKIENIVDSLKKNILSFNDVLRNLVKEEKNIYLDEICDKILK